MPKKSLKLLSRKIVNFIKKQVGKRQAVIGLSGGVDSATVTYLACQALGSGQVYALMMPSVVNTKQDVKHAELIITKLKIKNYKLINIEPIAKTFFKTSLFKTRLAKGNLRARIRMCLLYGLANSLGGLVLGTGNKTELAVGYFTKHGDAAVDILPLGDLYKTQVYELAKYLGIPPEIINKKPTAGLWKNQYDEEELGITYKKLDKILSQRIKNKKIEAMQKKSEHKRCLPPICHL